MRRQTLVVCGLLVSWGMSALAQAPAPAAPTEPRAPIAPRTAPAAPSAPAAPRTQEVQVAPQGVTPPPDYVIGADDQLAIIFWREKDMSAEVAVRPDGKISLPLLNDIQASGLTPDQLRLAITDAAGKFVEDPTITVVVKAINSRRVFITGMVGKPGPYSLTAPTTVLQLIALAGGVAEYAKSDQVQVMRTENSKTTNYRFNYKDVIKGKKLEQNLLLKPGDTVIVP